MMQDAIFGIIVIPPLLKILPFKNTHPTYHVEIHLHAVHPMNSTSLSVNEEGRK